MMRLINKYINLYRDERNWNRRVLGGKELRNGYISPIEKEMVWTLYVTFL